MAEEITLSVEIGTSQAKLDNLQEFMELWIKENESREIVQDVLIYSIELFDCRRMDLVIAMSHKGIVFRMYFIQRKSPRWTRKSLETD
jgi:hypothetical protein